MSERKRVKQVVIEGVVVDTRYRKDAKQLEHLLQYQDGEQVVERWFLDTQLEAVLLPEGVGEES